MTFQMYVETDDSELLAELAHEFGNIFYRQAGDDFEVIYYSGAKVVHFVGKLVGKALELVTKSGRQVQELSINRATGSLYIRDFETPKSGSDDVHT